MKRILIIGSPGSGKSTLAKALQQKLGLPLYHLDALYFLPHWQEPNRQDWRYLQEKLVQQERFIIDGTYSGTLAIRLARADTVIYLKANRFVCLYRVISRYVHYRGRIRSDMALLCPEKMDLTFLLYILRYSKKSAPRIDAILKEAGIRPTVLCGRHEIDVFLESNLF